MKRFNFIDSFVEVKVSSLWHTPTSKIPLFQNKQVEDGIELPPTGCALNIEIAKIIS